jgi:subtilisin family serine protease
MNKDIFLYPFEVKKVLSTLSQSQGWGIKQLNVPETWKTTKGSGITVMVIDTGYSDHPDLKGAMVIAKSRSFLKYEPDINDLNGHSTHCAGIIGARNNDIGMVGVAPECNIITLKVLGENGTGGFDAIRSALKYAIDVKPDVISMSLGSHSYDKEMHDLIKKLYEMNIPIIAAAGNDGKKKFGNKVIDTINYPAKYPEVISVAAYDKYGNPAIFNSYGSDNIDFSAPGVDIYSTWVNHEYVSISGTSMATPFVAGIVALLLAKHRKQELETGKNDCKTISEIKEHLVKYADDKGVVGKDLNWGYGVINPVELIKSSENDSIVTTTLEPVKKQNIISKIINAILNFFKGEKS